MSTTVILYLSLLIGLIAATVALWRRDRRAADAARNLLREETAQPLRRLPTPVDETKPSGLTDRIDHGLQMLMYQTGLDIGAEPAFLLMVLVGLAIGGSLFVWRDDPLQGSIGMIAGMAIPLVVFNYLRNERLKKIREQLPDSMDLMARAVRAGESLDQAIESVGRQSPDPLGIEFQRCARHLDMGLAMNAAMRSLTRRAPVAEMRILSATFSVQRRSGGNIAVTLDRLAGVIRDRLSYRRQFMAATGASRLATIMVASAGPLVFAYMMFAQPDYMGQFFELPGGTVLLSASCVLEVIGLVWVFGLLRNDY